MLVYFIGVSGRFCFVGIRISHSLFGVAMGFIFATKFSVGTIIREIVQIFFFRSLYMYFLLRRRRFPWPVFTERVFIPSGVTR